MLRVRGPDHRIATGPDGFDLLQPVRSSPYLKNMPAIAVTGHTRPEA